ncbi:type II toxin-antitoxin system PemK/MazF family toxin [Alkalibacterium iburiense]|uniref:Type II toxin-antitoxin system PemK/MazF family toxin n=1 Tax=Alkalibacterium iburiense TaxID=290589 RepID=A0ABN0X3I2_9LACT
MKYTINNYLPKQGDIVWFNSNPTSGREINKHRPALILSGTPFNAQTGFIVVAPITSTKHDQLIALPEKLKTKGYVNFIHLKSIDFMSENREVKYKESVDLDVIGRVAHRVLNIFNFEELFDL